MTTFGAFPFHLRHVGWSLPSQLLSMWSGLRTVISSPNPLPVPSLHSPLSSPTCLPCLAVTDPVLEAGSIPVFFFFSSHKKPKVKEAELSLPWGETVSRGGENTANIYSDFKGEQRGRGRRVRREAEGRESHPEGLEGGRSLSWFFLDLNHTGWAL